MVNNSQGPCAYPVGSAWLHVFIFIFVPALSLPLFPSSLGLGGAHLWAPAPDPRTCGSSRVFQLLYKMAALCLSSLDRCRPSSPGPTPVFSEVIECAFCGV